MIGHAPPGRSQGARQRSSPSEGKPVSGGEGARRRCAVRGPLVLDTNVALDLLVFDDPRIGDLPRLLEQEGVGWIATAAMRAELLRVLGYPQLGQRLVALGLSPGNILCRFDRLSRVVPAAPRCAIRCSDRDDQIFIDLAVAHRAVLLSKDLAVLRLHRRLRAVGAAVHDSVQSIRSMSPANSIGQ